MTFKEATDKLQRLGITVAEMAGALGKSEATVKQMRFDPSASGYRTPPSPEVWRPALARLARERGRTLIECADTYAREFVAANHTVWLVWADEDTDLAGTYWLTFESGDGQQRYSLHDPQTREVAEFSQEELHELMFQAQAFPPT